MKVKVYRAAGMLKQVQWSGRISSIWLYYGDGYPNWETFSLPSIETQKACKSALKAVLIGHANGNV